MGASLGGFLALHFAAVYPEQILSLLLCNSFADNRPFEQSAECVSLFQFMPHFYLQKYVLDSFPKLSAHPRAIDFAVLQLETLSRRDLAARLTLNCTRSEVPDMSFSQKKLTILDTHDEGVLPDSMRDRLLKRFPQARVAHVKDGGDFPFLSNAGEISMHIQVCPQCRASVT